MVGVALAGVLLILGPVVARAGTLSLGEPTVEDGQYVFPVVLQGENNVASLNFTLSYDATLFTPVTAEPGLQALRAGKQVAANVAVPGEYIVVVLGLNQTALASGEVARIGLEPIGIPSGETRLDLVDTSLASWEGPEIPSEGTGRSLSLGEAESKDPEAAVETPVKSAEAKAQSEVRGRPHSVVWTMAQGTGRLRPVALAPVRERAVEKAVAKPEPEPARAKAPENRLSPEVPKSLPGPTETRAVVGKSNLTGAGKKSIVESESNRASTPNAESASVNTGSKVGQTARGWIQWSFLALGAMAIVGVILLRRKLFG